MKPILILSSLLLIGCSDKTPNAVVRLEYGTVTYISKCWSTGKRARQCIIHTNKGDYILDPFNFPDGIVNPGDHLFYERRVYNYTYDIYLCKGLRCSNTGLTCFHIFGPCASS